MKHKTRTKALSWLLSLALVLGLFPSMSLTAYATDATEPLLTTITATAKEQASYSTANVATVSFSYTAGGSSAYLANWGWWGYGWTATVAPANGYTITKCVFYDDANRTATDSEAPFVVETTEEDKTPRINGTPIDGGNYQSKGLKKIEVYGYATPAHTHDFTYAASDATITATCSDTSCDLHSSPATLTLSAAEATYTGSAYTGASLTDTTAWTGAGLTAPTIEYAGRGSTSYTKSSTAPTNAGTYTASITVDTDKTATADFTINPMALTITGATATNRTYDKDSTAVTISAVTFKDSSQQAVALTVGEDKDYTVTGAMSDANAGDGKTVNVTVTLKNANYSLATNTTTATVNIGKANAQTIADMTDTLLYTAISVSESVAGKMPDDAGTLTYSAGSASKTGSVTVSNFDVNATSGAVTATLSGGAAGDTVTLPVTIGSTNYADSTVNVKITLTAKSDAGVDITVVPASKTYGDADFTLTGNVTNEGTGTGNWTWSTSDETVFQITPNGATATVKILKAGSATVTAKYESDTTIDTETTAAITVNTKTLRITAKDQSIYVGGTVPTLEGAAFYTVTGLVGTDALTTAPALAYQKDGSTATPDASAAGNYDIVPSGAAAGDNYTITYQNGTLTISSRPSPSSPSTPTTTVTVPVSGDDESVNVTVRVSGDTATITGADVDKVLEAEDIGTVTIDVSTLKQEVTEVVIPGAMVDKIADAVADESNNADGLEIKLPTGTVTFDAVAVAAISEQANGKDLRLNLEDIGESKLNTSQKTAVKDMDVQEVLDAYMTSGGQRISAFKGGKATVTVSYELKEGQTGRGVVVWYVAGDGEKTEVPTTFDEKTVSFTVEHFSNYVIAYDAERAAACPKDDTCPLAAFTDLDPAKWYHDGIEYCWENGLMVGVGDNRFGPNGTTSRAMIVSILYRLEGQPAVTAANPFSDVEPGRYYTNAVIWAAENEIVSGYGNGKFGPNDPITREQLAAILYRYAQSKGQGFTGTWSFKLDFPDAGDVSGWANEAVSWMVKNGIINGKDGKLVPKGDASRAEAATMLQRFCENVAK